MGWFTSSKHNSAWPIVCQAQNKSRAAFVLRQTLWMYAGGPLSIVLVRTPLSGTVNGRTSFFPCESMRRFGNTDIVIHVCGSTHTHTHTPRLINKYSILYSNIHTFLSTLNHSTLSALTEYGHVSFRCWCCSKSNTPRCTNWK